VQLQPIGRTELDICSSAIAKLIIEANHKNMTQLPLLRDLAFQNPKLFAKLNFIYDKRLRTTDEIMTSLEEILPLLLAHMKKVYSQVETDKRAWFIKHLSSMFQAKICLQLVEGGSTSYIIEQPAKPCLAINLYSIHPYAFDSHDNTDEYLKSCPDEAQPNLQEVQGSREEATNRNDEAKPPQEEEQSVLTGPFIESRYSEIGYFLSYNSSLRCQDQSTGVSSQSYFTCTICNTADKHREDMFVVGECNVCYDCMSPCIADGCCLSCLRRIVEEEHYMLQSIIESKRLNMPGPAEALFEQDESAEEPLPSRDDFEELTRSLDQPKQQTPFGCEKCRKAIKKLSPRQSTRFCEVCISDIRTSFTEYYAPKQASSCKKPCFSCNELFDEPMLIHADHGLDRPCNYCIICLNHNLGSQCPICSKALGEVAEFKEMMYKYQSAPCMLCFYSKKLIVSTKCWHISCCSEIKALQGHCHCHKKSSFRTMKLLGRLKISTKANELPTNCDSPP